MLDRLKDAEARYLSIEEQLADPSVFSDTEKFAALMKDYKALTPIIEKYREYIRAQNDNEDAYALLDEQPDAEMREMISEEIKSTKETMDRLFDELKILLLLLIF